MRILVTGVSGFFGGFIARALCAAGHDVVGVHRRDVPSLPTLVRAGVTLHRLDLIQSCQLPGPFDAVVHTAATSPAPGVDTLHMVRDNVEATAALVDAALGWSCRAFIFCSSLSVYGRVAGPVVAEESPIVDPDSYGLTKLLGERLLRESADRLPALVLRLPGVLGPGAGRIWMSSVAERIQAGAGVPAFHLDAPFNNAAHISDVTALVARVVTRPMTGFDTVVLGARGTLTVRAAIERLAQALGAPVSIEPLPPPKPWFIVSFERAIARWGYEPMEIGPMIDRYGAELRDPNRGWTTRE